MNVIELKEIIDGAIIDVPEGDCYIAIAKCGKDVSISYEGTKDMMTECLLRLMKKYKDLSEVVIDAADEYMEEEL